MDEAIKTEQEITEEEIQAEIKEETGSDRFVIDDDAKADWALRKIQAARAEIERWKTYYSGQLEKITAQQENRIAYLQSMLRGYFDEVPHKETKTQASYALPSGKLILKQGQPKFEINQDEILPWLEKNGLTDYIRTKREAAWGDIKKIVTVTGEAVATEDGEIVPGITVIHQEPEFQTK